MLEWYSNFQAIEFKFALFRLFYYPYSTVKASFRNILNKIIHFLLVSNPPFWYFSTLFQIVFITVFQFYSTIPRCYTMKKKKVHCVKKIQRQYQWRQKTSEKRKFFILFISFFFLRLCSDKTFPSFIVLFITFMKSVWSVKKIREENLSK